VARGIEEHRLPVRKAYLYGIVARGEDDPRSDVDVAVVVETDGDSVRSGLEDLAEELRASFGTNFHFMIATRPLDEMARKDEQGGALWAQIAAEAVEFM
jgi:predicted nucleotidyltransferase